MMYPNQSRDVSPVFVCPICKRRTLRGTLGYVVDLNERDTDVCRECFDTYRATFDRGQLDEQQRAVYWEATRCGATHDDAMDAALM